MSKDWDEEYRSMEYRLGKEPAGFLVRLERFLPDSGRALDIAAGEGRNAVYLAARGLTVDAVDSSVEGLRKAAALASERGVSIRTVVTDLESFDLGDARYDLVVNFYYLERELVARIKRAIRPGGLVVFETYTIDQLTRPSARGPRNPDHLLQPGELVALFEGFEIVHSAETVTDRKAVASLVARRPAPS